jgi:DNA-binding NtrC family response regulator
MESTIRKNAAPAPTQTRVASNTVLIHVGMTLRQAEELLIVATLQHTDGNVREAARILGINRSTLYEKVKLYSIEWTRERRKGVCKPPEER